MRKYILEIYYPQAEGDNLARLSPEVVSVIVRSALDESNHERKKRYHNANATLADENYVAKHAADWTPTVEEKVESMLEKEAVHRALSKLPPIQRRRVYAYYFLGYSLAEVALLEGVSRQAISQSLRASRKQLRKELTDMV